MDCMAASYEKETKVCKKHTEAQDHTLVPVDTVTGLYAAITSRRAATDGFAVVRGRLNFAGAQVGSFNGHRSVTFCKAKCAEDPLCNSFQYHDHTGCYLRTACVTSSSILLPAADSFYYTYYKTKGECTPLWDLDEASRDRVFYPEDPFGSSVSTFARAFMGNRRRGFRQNYYLKHLMRTGFAEVSIEESDAVRRLDMDELAAAPLPRRLAAVGDCGVNCTEMCRPQSATKAEMTMCQIACLEKCAEENVTSDDSDLYWTSSSTTYGSAMYTGTTTMLAEDSDNETMTVTMTTRSSSMVAQDSENWTMSMTMTTSSSSMVTEDSDNATMTTSATSSTSTYVLYGENESTTAEDSDNETWKMTMTTTATSTATQDDNTTTTATVTSTVTTTQPPPPVRLVALSGDIFNVGDPLPEAGFVSGRVEVFYNDHWGTVCKDGFDDVEAQVVCNELGLAGTWGRYDSSAQAGLPGSEEQTIWLDDLNCQGDEGFLSTCENAGWGINNCWHTEDAKVTCDTVTTTQTTQTITRTDPTTSTTTAFPLQTVTARKGFVRQDLTGRCLGPTSCEEEAELQAQECEFFLPGTMQRWEVNTLGMMQSIACPGMCAGPSGETPVSWVKRSMILVSCNHTEFTYENTEQRFVFHEQGQIQSQWSSMCLDTEGDLGYGDGTIVWKACEMQASCWKRNYKWTPDSMPGTGQESEPTAADCQQRCKSVAGCTHFSWWTNGRCFLQDSSAVLTYDHWAYQGPAECEEMISDQLWKFVEADVAKVPKKGLLRSAGYSRCIAPAGGTAVLVRTEVAAGFRKESQDVTDIEYFSDGDEQVYGGETVGGGSHESVMATFTKLAARQVRKVFQAVGNPDAGLGLSQWLSLFELRLKVSVRVALTETEDPFSSQKAILSKGDILTQLEPDFEREGMQRAKVQCPHLASEGYVTLRANRGTVHVQSFPQDLENLALAEPVDLARSAAAAVTEKELKLQDEAMDRGDQEAAAHDGPELCGSRAGFVRAVREILGEKTKTFRFTPDALHLLQLTSEWYITDAAADWAWLAMHAKRKTVQIEDVISWKRLRHDR
eukprot:s2691_g8.t1